jgi:hypothetical protein
MIQNKIPLLNLLSSVSQITAQIILSKLGFKAIYYRIDIIVYLVNDFSFIKSVKNSIN